MKISYETNNRSLKELSREYYDLLFEQFTENDRDIDIKNIDKLKQFYDGIKGENKLNDFNEFVKIILRNTFLKLE